MTPRSAVAVVYIPVLHRGYINFIDKLVTEGVTTVYVVSDEMLARHEELDYINRKDRLRALTGEEVVKFLRAGIPCAAELLTVHVIEKIKTSGSEVHMPQEDISAFIAETYFKGCDVIFHSVFLRWNRENVGEEKVPDTQAITLTEVKKTVMGMVLSEALKSADWWRQVGAALVKDDTLLALAHNEHMPEKELPNILGDTRALFKKGVHINYVTAAHAEVGVIGEAARKGISTDDAELFVTDFPCPYCARLIAKSGITRVYFLKGYAVLEGDEFLKQMGIDTIRVSMEE